MRAVEALLKGLVDYAGLFPPASERMRDALESYATYKRDSNRRALGRFIVPLSRLQELQDEGEDLLPRVARSEPWKLSVLVGPDVRSAAEQMREFNRNHSPGSPKGNAVIDVVELKAGEPVDIEGQHAALPEFVTPYFEIPGHGDTSALVETIASVGGRAKIRTGGVTPDSFPSSQDVAEFLEVCHRHSVAFKATAGLHHPIRGSYRLTYEPRSASSMMFGFLNVFLAAAAVHSGQSVETARALLEEADRSAFAFTDDAITWRGLSVDVDEITRLRSEFAISFGSCSFREPIDELGALDHSLVAQHS